MPPFTRCCLIATAAFLLAPAAAASNGAEALRAEFSKAFDAVDVDASDSPALRNYPLYPWLQAERLRLQLADGANGALDSLIAEFLDQHGSAPHTQALRGAWWDSLFRRERWGDFIAALGSRPGAAGRLCQWLTAHQKSGRMENFRDDALAAWHNGRSMPDACDAAFEWLDAGGHLTSERVAARLRLALDANQFRLARALTDRLPESEQRVWTNARLAREQGGTFLRRLIEAPDAPIHFDDLRAGLHRHARGDAEAARRTLRQLIDARSFDARQTGELHLAVAMPAAWSRQSIALPLFQRVPLSQHDEQQLEWHARAALWAQDWDAVLRVIDGMPAALSGHTRWRYWTARAAVAQGAAAETAYAELARDRSFHGFLAAARIGRPPHFAPQVTERRRDAQRQLANLPAVQRAREWFHLEDNNRGVTELAWAFADFDADGLEQAALMLSDWGWHQQAIAWLARSGRWDDLMLRFPLPFADAFEQAAEATGVSPTWLHTIVRTESLYDPRAVSGAGARGIAQVMPPTATGIARRNGLAYGGSDDLFDVELNVLFGAHYLRELDEHFAGNWLFVVPAYNAGRGRIPGWLPDAPLDADIWMENIPFNETRGYIQRALYHYVIVHWRLTGKPGDLTPFIRQRVPSGLGNGD